MALYILGRRAKVLVTEEFFSDLSKIALACTGKHPSTAHPIHHTIIPALPCLNSPRRIWFLSNVPLTENVRKTHKVSIGFMMFHAFYSTCPPASSSALPLVAAASASVPPPAPPGPVPPRSPQSPRSPRAGPQRPPRPAWQRSDLVLPAKNHWEEDTSRSISIRNHHDQSTITVRSVRVSVHRSVAHYMGIFSGSTIMMCAVDMGMSWSAA